MRGMMYDVRGKMYDVRCKPLTFDLIQVSSFKFQVSGL